MTAKDDKITSEIDLKKKLIEATEAVRKKFFTVKNRHLEENTALEKFYEPISKPLKNISDATEEFKNRIISTPQSILKTEKEEKPSKYFRSQKDASSEEEYDSEDDDYEKLSDGGLIPTPPDTSLSTIGTPSFSGQSSDQTATYIPSSYVEDLRSNDEGYDTVYGVRVEPKTNKLLMGNAEVRFSGNNISLWRRGKKLKTFAGNSELYDLIFLKLPPVLRTAEGVINESNLQTYAEILKLTNAAYKGYRIKLGRNASKSKKYLQIIKPLISHSMKTRASRYSGSGVKEHKLPTQKAVRPNKTDYVYWNKPQELVARLRLLWSSKIAGHTGHDNEILSIIEELREENIIY